MDPLVIFLLLLANGIFGTVIYIYFKKTKDLALSAQVDAEKRERELKRQILELQVLRSLGERVGYSLDILQILEVITDSLRGLVEFSTISFIILGDEGRANMKIKVNQPISRLFLDTVKMQILNSFSVMAKTSIHPELVDLIVSGTDLDESNAFTVGSYFNLPIVIGNQIVAMINVSSTKKGLYGDEETVILYTIINQVSSQATKLSQVLENEKRRLSSMVSSLTDGIFMVGKSYNLIVSNPVLYSILNIKLDSSFLEIEEALKKFIDLKTLLHQSLTTHKILNAGQFEINGRAVEIQIEPVIDKFSYLLGAVVVLKDISAQKQLERLRDEFTAMMVHELRTPLTTVSYAIEAIVSDYKTLQETDLMKFLGVIKDSSTELLALVNDLLDVAKIESGKFSVIKRPTNLKELIETKITGLKPQAEQKKINLEVSVDPKISQVMLDPMRIGQAIINLVANAIKYTDSGFIRISALDKGNMIEVSFTDTGDGIKAEDLPKLFSKFRQVGKGKTGEKGGTGLGLVIVKGIINAHGGNIWASSQGVGHGSTFTFTLPKA